ncbi:MAG: acyl carrier protein [Pirellulaceae bacterium]|nr:acyl carrier protein [Pirellulaceae bacterium]
MPSTDNIAERIHTWVLEQFPLARERNIALTDSLLDSGIVDSLGTLDIVQFLESDFDLVVEDEEMVADHFESIQAIVLFVERKVGS